MLPSRYSRAKLHFSTCQRKTSVKSWSSTVSAQRGQKGISCWREGSPMSSGICLYVAGLMTERTGPSSRKSVNYWNYASLPQSQTVHPFAICRANTLLHRVRLLPLPLPLHLWTKVDTRTPSCSEENSQSY
jgi:hypothetical protein